MFKSVTCLTRVRDAGITTGGGSSWWMAPSPWCVQSIPRRHLNVSWFWSTRVPCHKTPCAACSLAYLRHWNCHVIGCVCAIPPLQKISLNPYSEGAKVPWSKAMGTMHLRSFTHTNVTKLERPLIYPAPFDCLVSCASVWHILWIGRGCIYTTKLPSPVDAISLIRHYLQSEAFSHHGRQFETWPVISGIGGNGNSSIVFLVDLEEDCTLGKPAWQL